MAIARALKNANCIRIDELCLGGNLLIDGSIMQLSTTLLHRSRGMKFIGLEDNFISCKAMLELADMRESYNIVF